MSAIVLELSDIVSSTGVIVTVPVVVSAGILIVFELYNQNHLMLFLNILTYHQLY
jgi:hypothetical protein